MFPNHLEVTAALRPQINNLEQKRTAHLSKSYKYIAASIGMVAVFILCLLLIGEAWAVLGSLLLTVITILTSVIVLVRSYSRFRRQFKSTLIAGVSRELVEHCELPNETPAYQYICSYMPDSRISDSHIDNCFLFNERIDEIDGEDLVTGKLGLTDFEFSELKLVRIDESRNSKGQRTTSHVTLFDGVLFVADFHKEFRGTTLLLSQGFLGLGGWANRMGNSVANLFRGKRNRIDNIQLENDSFNKMFNTVTNDEVEARYILSSSFMERILEFQRTHPNKLELAFTSSRMYVAISCSRNYFEPRINQPIGSQIATICDEFAFFFGLVEQFDLNTRIWSKT